MSIGLIGRTVRIGLVDPWDFVTENGESRIGHIIGEIAGAQSQPSVLQVKLNDALLANGLSIGVVFAAVRHTQENWSQLLSDTAVLCNFSDRIDTGGQLVAGSFAFIGDIKLVP